VPTMLPTAPMARATSMDVTAMPTATTPLARTVRLRRGTRVNVVSPLRWLHSLVTDRIAITGSSTDIGKPIAVANDSEVSSSCGANATVAAVAMKAVMAMLAISQKPDRVLKDFLSSTEASRENGMGAGAGRAARGASSSTATVVMLLLLLGSGHVGSLR